MPLAVRLRDADGAVGGHGSLLISIAGDVLAAAMPASPR